MRASESKEAVRVTGADLEGGEGSPLVTRAPLSGKTFSSQYIFPRRADVSSRPFLQVVVELVELTENLGPGRAKSRRNNG